MSPVLISVKITIQIKYSFIFISVSRLKRLQNEVLHDYIAKSFKKVLLIIITNYASIVKKIPNKGRVLEQCLLDILIIIIYICLIF